MANMNISPPPETPTPDNVPWWQLRLAEITDPEGDIAQKAAGDENYRRFLEEEAVAALDSEVYPDRPELQHTLQVKIEAREAYEAAVLGVQPQERE